MTKHPHIWAYSVKSYAIYHRQICFTRRHLFKAGRFSEMSQVNQSTLMWLQLCLYHHYLAPDLRDQTNKNQTATIKKTKNKTITKLNMFCSKNNSLGSWDFHRAYQTNCLLGQALRESICVFTIGGQTQEKETKMCTLSWDLKCFNLRLESKLFVNAVAINCFMPFFQVSSPRWWFLIHDLIIFTKTSITFHCPILFISSHTICRILY